VAGNVEHDHIGLVFENLCKIDDILDELNLELFLPRAAATTLMSAVENHLLHYGHLSYLADRQGHLLFTAAPKHHMMYHWGAKAMFLNPRRTACFLDDDYVNVIKNIARSCTAGLKLHKIVASVAVKHRWGLHMQHKYGV